MAIDQRGQVTTTGMMNNPTTNAQVPDMSNLVCLLYTSDAADE